MRPPLAAADVTAALAARPAGPAPGRPFGRLVTDSRRVAAGDLFVALRGERFDGNAFLADAAAAGAAGAVGEDVPFEGRDRLAYWAVGDGRRALQRIAAFHRARLDVRVVGITGTNGKTTTKELVAAVLGQAYPTAATRGNLNNQVGVPLTLLEIGPEHHWAVVEMGMNRPGEIAPLAAIADPRVGIVTNVGASHLEGMGSVEAVMEEKLALGRALGPDDLLAYGGDDPALRAAVRGLACRTLAYGLEPENDLAPESWSLDEDGRGRFRLDGRTFRLRLTGAHNIVNALAAVAVGREAGLEDATIAAGLAEPDALPLRMQLERWGDVVALVDCYNANPDSVRSAAGTLDGLSGVRRRVAVIGEMLELGPRSPELHAEVGRDLAGGGINLVVAVGAGAAPVADGAEAGGVRAERFSDREAAARWLAENLAPGDGILFKASRGSALEEVVVPVRDAWLVAGAREGR